VKFVIFDIDNCLADDSRRREKLPRHASPFPYTDKDYASYHHGAANDEVINGHVLNGHLDGGTAEIVFITARPRAYFGKTEWWLKEKFPNLVDVSYHILMRPYHNTQSSPELKVSLFEEFARGELGHGADLWDAVLIAYDDRLDVLEAYAKNGSKDNVLLSKRRCVELSEAQDWEAIITDGSNLKGDVLPNVPDILEEMAATFRERNKVYGDSWEVTGNVMKALYPDGLPDPKMIHLPQWHMFEWMITKLARYAMSGLTHKDSAHDIAVYAAMSECQIARNENK